MKKESGLRFATVATIVGVTFVLAAAIQPASAQSLATEFNAILNGPNGVANRCRTALPNNPQCDDYNITPTTDLQMRFAAPEELAAQKSAVKEFSSQQLKNVAGRLGVLRMQTASNYRSDVQRALLADNTHVIGGGAAASPDSGGSALSGYVNLSHGFGSRDQTAYEDEADYSGNDLVVGADYRINPMFVAGVALGYADKSIDMAAMYTDAVTVATINAAATSDADGFGATLYGQFEANSFYANASVGLQSLDYDLVRRADYVTGAPTVALTARGTTKSSAVQLSVNVGYVLSFGATSIDTAIGYQSQEVDTDGFQETGANCTTGACAGTDLNMRFDDQTIESAEASLSIRAQHAFTVRSTVLIPFVSAEYIDQQNDDRFVISGMYVPLYGQIPNFNLNTDALDTEYYAVAAGFSMVMQGGWQAFLRYRTTLELENVSDSVVAAGVRYEF